MIAPGVGAATIGATSTIQDTRMVPVRGNVVLRGELKDAKSGALLWRGEAMTTVSFYQNGGIEDDLVDVAYTLAYDLASELQRSGLLK
jgi:hypothetical protein